MDKDMWISGLVGLITASSLYVWKSEEFTKNQKIFLLTAILFFPIQWIGILICLKYNSYKENNTEEKIAERETQQKTDKLYSQIVSLSQLKEKGILTEEEYNQKVSKIEQEKAEENLKNSQEYKQLKNLFENNILTEEEFESKIPLLNKPTLKITDFRIIDGFSEGLGLAINSELDYGFVDENLNVVIDFIFDHAENFNCGVAKVIYKGELKIIDKKGNYLE